MATGKRHLVVRTSTTGFNGTLIRQWGLNGDIALADTDFDG